MLDPIDTMFKHKTLYLLQIVFSNYSARDDLMRGRAITQILLIVVGRAIIDPARGPPACILAADCLSCLCSSKAEHPLDESSIPRQEYVPGQRHCFGGVCYGSQCGRLVIRIEGGLGSNPSTSLLVMA